MKAIIFDFNRTIYDPESKRLVYGARQILELSARNYRLFLVSQRENGREEILIRKDLSRYFTRKYFVNQKNRELFCDIIAQNDLEPSQVLVVGDNLQSEIRAGIEAGCKTIRIRKGRFAGQRVRGIKPDFTITDIRQLPGFL